MSSISQVQKAMEGEGFFLHDAIVADGKIHRFKRDQHDSGRSAWYLCFQNHSHAGEIFFVCHFGDWHEPGNTREFISSFVKSKYDKATIDKQLEEARRKAEAERARIYELASVESQIEWKQFRTTGSTEYMKRKGVKGLYGARTFPGLLLVPVVDTAGKMWGYQQIYDEQGKWFREGTKKEGNFFPIGDWKTAEVIYLCEGFATGVSIHQATGGVVAVAFDSGNLPAAAVALRSARADCPIVVCGDDDQWTTKPDGTPWNPGREKAEEAAKRILGKAIFPSFKSLADRPTDFNDLAALEGEEKVKAQVQGVDVEVHRVLCLGHKDDTYYYISTSNEQIVPIACAGHTKNNFLNLMPISFWESRYPEKGGVDWDLAASEMMETCRRNGVFDASNVRGGGVWIDEDKVVVNLGNRLWVDGRVAPLNSFKSRYTYEISDRMEPVHDFPLTAGEGAEFLKALEMMRWRKPDHARLAAGFLMIAPLCGALPWRPHVWVNGPSGSGKTWFMEQVVKVILSPSQFAVQGNTTEAGVRQKVGSSARPLIFDEFETDDEKSAERIRDLLELFRQASSPAARVVKGSATGKAMEFSVRFSAIVSSIRQNLQMEQDKNRFTSLDLNRGEGEGQAEQFKQLQAALGMVSPEFGRRMFARGVVRLKTILANYKQLHEILSEKHNSRFGQQYGIILAGYAALIHDRPITEGEAHALADNIDLGTEIEATGDHDEQECLHYLLRRVTGFDLKDAGRRELSFHEVAVMALKDPNLTHRDHCRDALNRFGVKVDSGFLYVATSNPSLKSLFRGTKWTGGWDKPLLRLNGATRSLNRMGGGNGVRCVKIPLEIAGLDA